MHQTERLTEGVKRLLGGDDCVVMAVLLPPLGDASWGLTACPRPTHPANEHSSQRPALQRGSSLRAPLIEAMTQAQRAMVSTSIGCAPSARDSFPGGARRITL